SRLAYDLEAFVSPAIAAALLTVLSYNSLFVGTSVGFAASAALVLSAAIPARSAVGPATTFWERLPVGAKVFAATPSLRFLLCTNIVVAAGTALVLVNSVVYSKVVFGFDDAALAVMLGAYGIGSLLIAINIPWVVYRFGVTRTMKAGVLTVLVGLVAAVAATSIAVQSGAGWWALIVTWAVLGAGT